MSIYNFDCVLGFTSAHHTIDMTVDLHRPVYNLSVFTVGSPTSLGPCMFRKCHWFCWAKEPAARCLPLVFLSYLTAPNQTVDFSNDTSVYIPSSVGGGVLVGGGEKIHCF